MEFGVFLICSLLFAGSYVDSRSLPHANGEFSSALNELSGAKEFLESTLSKIKNIAADDDEADYETSNLKNRAEYAISIVLEVINLGPSKAIETEEILSEIVELLHQSSEMEKSGDELEEALKSVEMAEEIITQIRNNQQDTTVKYIRYMVDIVNEIKAKVDADPENLLQQLQNPHELPQMLAGAPKYLSHLLKKSFFEMIEQLWNADMTVESIKAAHPSEAEQLKTLLREVEDKMNTLRKETKKLAAKMTLTIVAHIFPSDDILRSLSEVDSKYTQDVISIGGEMSVSEDDPSLEELRTKMIEMGDILDGANPIFLEHIDNVIELIQSNFPEENQLEGLVDELKIKTSELKESIKTIVDKIKLDASEGLKTNCLYAEMFAHVLKDKIDVFLRNLNEMENILSSLQMELPDGEVKSSIDEALEKMNSIGIDTESDPFSEFLKQSMKTFYVFGVGMTELSSIPDETDILAEMGGL